MKVSRVARLAMPALSARSSGRLAACAQAAGAAAADAAAGRPLADLSREERAAAAGAARRAARRPDRAAQDAALAAARAAARSDDAPLCHRPLPARDRPRPRRRCDGQPGGRRHGRAAASPPRTSCRRCSPTRPARAYPDGEYRPRRAAARRGPSRPQPNNPFAARRSRPVQVADRLGLMPATAAQAEAQAACANRSRCCGGRSSCSGRAARPAPESWYLRALAIVVRPQHRAATGIAVARGLVADLPEPPQLARRPARLSRSCRRPIRRSISTSAG